MRKQLLTTRLLKKMRQAVRTQWRRSIFKEEGTNKTWMKIRKQKTETETNEEGVDADGAIQKRQMLIQELRKMYAT